MTFNPSARLLTAGALAWVAVAGLAIETARGADRPQPAAASTRAVQLAPHRAIYSFTLGTVRASNSVSSLSGRMVYEFTGSECDGYNQSMRFVTRTGSQDGEVTLNDQRSTSWEDVAATRYRFQSTQYRDERLVEQTAGTAKRGTGEEDIAVDLTHPDKKTAGIGGHALFPIQHSIKLIEAARAGRSNFRAEFYDGSDGGEKSFVVNAQIGQQLPAQYNKSLSRVGQADKLDGMPAWPVALSYFDHGAELKDALPTYEMSFVFFQNGVSRKLVIDNGEYAMKGELTDLVMLEPTPCKK